MAMKTKEYSEIRRQRLSEEEIADNERWVDRELLEMDLKAMRELVGKTQVEVAGLLDMTQPEVSKLEQRQDYLLSTLRRVVQGLGGELEVIANFGDKRVRLRGAG